MAAAKRQRCGPRRYVGRHTRRECEQKQPSHHHPAPHHAGVEPALPRTVSKLLELAGAVKTKMLLPTLLSLAGVRLGGAGAQPLVVVGAGVLGRLAAQEWQALHPGAEVLGVTRTRPDEEREAAMRAEGITHRYRSDIEAAERCGTRWPYILFSASPGGNDDYAAAVASALEYWEKDAPGARFVFTSSAGVHAEQDGGVVTETSPVGSGARAERLLAAEHAVLAAGGCVVRLAGLYLEDRGAHNYWLTQEEVAQRPDGLINQVHYRDAASAAVAALVRGSPGSVYLAADDKPLTREQICVEARRAPRFAGRTVPAFTGSGGGVGKIIDSSASRAALRWRPKYSTFGVFIDTLL